MAKQNAVIIKWDKSERERFKELIREVKKQSVALANKIIDSVEINFEHVKQNPKIFEADHDKINNDGSHRKFTVLHIKIVYKINPNQIFITRVRHAASDPLEY